MSVGDPLDWWRVEEVLPGHLYWWAIKPFHGLVFGGMQRNIATAAEGRGHPAGSRHANRFDDGTTM